MVQGLVLGTDMPGIGMRRQRFDTLSFNRQHESLAVFDKATLTIRMPQSFPPVSQ